MSNNDPETPKTSATGKLPLRGFAMVLIAVAVLLGLWAVYSLTQNNGESADQAAETATSQAPGEPAETSANEPADGATGGAAESAESAESETAEAGAPPAEGQDSEAREAREAEESGDPADRDAAAAPGGAKPEGARDARDAGGAAAPAEPARLNVLNNSTVPNLAADVSERLREDGYELGEVGNLPDEIFPETTVFFTPGNPEAETEARELASRLNGVARENVESLPSEATGANDITLVLIGDVAL